MNTSRQHNHALRYGNQFIEEAIKTVYQLSYLTATTTNAYAAYYYHTDHLGSSSWISNSSGAAQQYLVYLPFGETLLDRRANTTWNTMFSFSGKERDSETGYSYFGARYYDAGTSIWLSVDPMASKYPGTSPYAYCRNNPIRLIDPDGMEWVDAQGTKIEDHSNIKFIFSMTQVKRALQSNLKQWLRQQ